jgi:dTDP-4-dehydrorhamnose reductase
MNIEKQSIRILVIGADGMAGHMIKMYLEENEYDVYTTTRKESDGKNSFLDVLVDFKELRGIISKIQPKFVINCIGVLNQFAEDNKSGAVLINSFFPHHIDSLSEKGNFKLVHISTDCVFSGLKGNYIETDSADADSFYGRSKALGEVNNSRNITFRTSIVGPDINENGIGLFNWFIKQKGETKGFSGVIWTGVTTLELAKSIEKSFNLDITGLYHLVNNEKINKYELLSLFKKSMCKNIEIKEDSAYVNDKSVISTRKDFEFNIPSYEVMINEMAKWIYDHPEKYNSIIINSKQ